MSVPTISAPAGEAERMRYLREVAQLLWPHPATVAVGRGRSAPAAGQFVLVPHRRRPRLLVPRARRPAATATLHYGEPGSVRARLRTRILAGALACGAGEVGIRDRVHVQSPSGAETIETRLRAWLGRDLLLSLHLGPPRANRKPVLQLLTPRGETVAFAKVGVDALTRELVRSEASTLREVQRARLRYVRAPRVLHQERWNGLEVLVLSALPVWRCRRPLQGSHLAMAMTEIAGVHGLRRRTLRESPYWRELLDRLAGTGEHERAALAATLETIGDHADDVELEFGSWHGDWAPWNMATLRHGVLVWDWERFRTGIPLGFDALHYRLQADATSRRTRPRDAVHRLVARSPEVLAPFGAGAHEARVTALLYVADLAMRYLADGQESTGARLGAVGSWLLPALTAETMRLAGR